MNLLPENEDDEKKAKLMRLLHTSKHYIDLYLHLFTFLGHVGKSTEGSLKPLIEMSKPSTSKRKIEDSLAFTVTKARVTSHLLGRRAHAFDAGESSSTTAASSAHESLFKAIKEGKVRKSTQEPSSSSNADAKDTNNDGNSAFGLVTYEDSD